MRRISAAIVAAVLVSGSPAGAGINLYDMDSLLRQAHPFAVARPAAPEAVRAPGQGAEIAVEFGGGGALKPGVAPGTEIDEDEDVNDPLEPLNRAFFGFNQILETVILGPVARTYNRFVPTPIRTGIGNFFDNLREPVVFANDVLQFEPKRALNTAVRFAVNSTVGVAGFIDVAEKLGYPEHDEDFGQTLAVWGVGEMFYLVLPVFGPSSPRDVVGKLFVDGYFDPLGLYLGNTDQNGLSMARTVTGGIVSFAGVVDDLDRLKETSIDYYGALRSLYRQKRKADIANGEVTEDLPDFDFKIDGPDLKLP